MWGGVDGYSLFRRLTIFCFDEHRLFGGYVDYLVVTLRMTKPSAVIVYILQQKVLFVTVYFSGLSPLFYHIGVFCH